MVRVEGGRWRARVHIYLKVVIKVLQVILVRLQFVS